MTDCTCPKAETYDRLFKYTNYNNPASTDSAYKFAFIEAFVAPLPDNWTLFDIGSGRGYNTKRLLESGRQVVAVDFSDVIESYTKDPRLKTYKADVLTFLGHSGCAPESAVICTDFMEHLPASEVEQVLRGISALSPYALFGIANHSDMVGGVELHLTQEDTRWWQEWVSAFYCNVVLTPTKYGDRYFFIAGANHG